MKKSTKVLLILSSVLLAVGIVLCGAALCLKGFDITAFNSEKFTDKVYTLDEDFESITVDALDADVEFYESPDDKFSVICPENENVTHELSVTDGTLSIFRNAPETSGFFNISLGSGDRRIRIFLPQKSYSSLKVETAMGDVAIPPIFTFDDMRIYTTSGEITVKAAATGLMLFSTASGDISISDTEAPIVELSTVSGEVELEKLVAEKSIYVKTTSGDIELGACDAPEIDLESVSGDINCGLLTPKSFKVETVSGDAVWPTGFASDESCNIKTVSGDIEVDVAQLD